MNDLISRQATIEIIQSMYPGMPRVPGMREEWRNQYDPYIRMENAIRALPTIGTVSTNDHVYRAGYTQAIKDIIEYMDNSHVLEYYVDPYEIGGFIQCLKNVGDTLIKKLCD